jgi:hypothetical protein
LPSKHEARSANLVQPNKNISTMTNVQKDKIKTKNGKKETVPVEV